MISLLVSLAVLIIGYLLYGRVTEKVFAPDDNGFQTIWRYFSWCNQTLVMIALWVATAYLIQKGKYRFGSLITALPATFMSAVCMTYFLISDEGFHLMDIVAYTEGAAFALMTFGVYVFFFIRINKKRKNTLEK